MNPLKETIHCDCSTVTMVRKCSCGTYASFAMHGQKESHCVTCKLPEMIDVVNRKCVCGKAQPTFGKPGAKATHCGKCKLPDMIDVHNKRCACGSAQPAFALHGNPASHCGDCKLPDMIDVRSKRCICGKSQPSFAMAGSKPSRCGDCKLPEMIDVKKTLCFCGSVQPSFAMPGDKASRCSRCMSPDMVNVVSPRCVCGKSQPLYAMPDQKATHCSSCMSPDMVNVVSPKCICGKARPNFAMPGQKPTHCAKCLLPGMEDVNHRKLPCQSCGLDERRDHLKDGLCYPCRAGKPRIELQMRTFLQSEYSDLEFQFNKTTEGLLICADRRYRPDCWLELADKVIVVECDEHQHESHDRSCELRRTVELLAACQGKPLQMIRWNPDEFFVDSKKRKVSIKKRLEALRHALAAAMDRLDECQLTVQYMYYDDVREAALQKELAEALRAYLAAGL